MLEETAGSPSSTAAPTFWAVINSWFTSTVFFLVLQVVIAPIYVTSNIASNQNQKQEQDSQGDDTAITTTTTTTTTQEELHRPRSPSRLERLNSIKFQSYTYTFHENPLHHVHASHARSPTRTEEKEETEKQQHRLKNRLDEDTEQRKSLDEVYSQILEGQRRHFSRSRSDAELPGKVVVRKMNKSALSHFVSGGNEGVDAKADDFIKKFKEQLKLQRFDSIINT